VSTLQPRLTALAANVKPAGGGRPSAVSQPASEKRPQGTPATVTIVAIRAKGGFEVQEAGKPKGVINLGPVPSPPPEIGTSHSVFIHDDNSTCPQYRWDDPHAGKTPKKTPRRK
jgi:hypothetical protein